MNCVQFGSPVVDISHRSHQNGPVLGPGTSSSSQKSTLHESKVSHHSMDKDIYICIVYIYMSCIYIYIYIWQWVIWKGIGRSIFAGHFWDGVIPTSSWGFRDRCVFDAADSRLGHAGRSVVTCRNLVYGLLGCGSLKFDRVIQWWW